MVNGKTEKVVTMLGSDGKDYKFRIEKVGRTVERGDKMAE